MTISWIRSTLLSLLLLFTISCTGASSLQWVADGRFLSWSEAQQYCANYAFTDFYPKGSWRMPTESELLSCSRNEDCRDAIWSGNTLFWSSTCSDNGVTRESTPDNPCSSRAMVVDIEFNDSLSWPVDNPNKVACVATR